MTEAQWVTCTDPWVMLRQVRDRATDRQWRLFACGCARRVWDLLTDGRSRRSVEAGEDFADRRASCDQLHAAEREAGRACRELDDAVDGLLDSSPGELSESVGQALAAQARAWVAVIASSSRLPMYLAVPDSYSAPPPLPNVVPPPDDFSARQALRLSAYEDLFKANVCLLRDIFGNPFRPAPALSPSVLAWGGRGRQARRLDL